MEKFTLALNYYKLVYRMKKTLKDTGASEKAKVDYFEQMRASDPIESYDIKEFRKRVEAQRKRKAQKRKPGDNS